MESPFEIERVEWVPATAEALEVHVYGRWRAAAPDAAELVVRDAAGTLLAYPSRAAGVGETGTWHARFAVPVELRSRLSSRLTLRAGEREIALPAASPGPVAGSTAPPPATVVEPTVLAQRRAAREGAADEALVRRAQAAEATVSTLETQLDHLEARLRDATAERERLAARLRAAEQRAEAERRVRGEAEDERDALRSEVERQVYALRARAQAAEEHAEALGAEMDGIRREAAEAQHAAAAARLAVERAGGRRAEAAQAELDRLGAEAGELARRLDRERDLRTTAETQLARQSERVAEVEATVALLERELERRASVQTSVQSELEGLREALALVRARTQDAASRDTGAQRTQAELQSTAAALRERVTALEATERAAREELRSAQAELSARGRDLERARIDVERSRAELAAAQAAQDSTTAALREAERTIVAVRGEAADLQARLDDERRRRFEAEAALKVEMERERERWGGQVAEIEGRLQARIASERRAFEEQAAAIEQLVAGLRQRLAGAGDELEERLSAAQRQRDEALAERDAARADADRVKRDIAADLERAAAERELLVGRVAEAEELVGQAHAQIQAARGEGDAARAELERLRAAADDVAVRDAAIEALVADVLATAGALRDGVVRQLTELQDRVEAEVATLRAQLEDERTARLVAEQELAAERARGIDSTRPSVLEAMSRSELETARRELAAAQEQLAAERRRASESEDLEAQTSRLVADLEAANARLKVAETEPPPVDEPLEPEPGVEEPPAEAPAVDEPPAEAPGVEEPLVDEPLTEPSALSERPFGRPAPRTGGELDAPADARPLATRFVRPSERPLTGWLTPAIAALAERDGRLGAEAILELLPAQAGIVRDALPYRLTIDGHGSYGVTLERDRTVVESEPSAGSDAVRVSGTPGALAPLVAGGARRRMPGVRIEGRKRRLRKLLRARRAPLDLARLADHGVRPAPELVLAILCAAVEPSWTAGHRFGVVYALAGGERLEVAVRDGQPLHAGPAAADHDEAPAATISLRADALLPLLARLHLPHDAEQVLVAGDGHAVALLHGWFDRAQGLPGG